MLLPRSMLLIFFVVGALGQPPPSLRAGGDRGALSLEWPFSPPTNRTSESDACAAQLTCGKCNDVSFCHWCDKDQSCHVMGSIHGCLSGSNCLAPSPPRPSPRDKNDTSCFSHKTCSECALASHLCHWCGHDNACHAIGSLHGCTVGVDCFSNARCERREPEPVKSIVFTQMGWKPFCLLLVVALSGMLCVLSCWCVNAQIKGAYDDLALAFLQGQNQHNHHSRQVRSRTASGSAVPSSPGRPASGTATASDDPPVPQPDDGDEEPAVVRGVGGRGYNGGSRHNHVDEYVRLVEGSEDADDSEPDLQTVASLRLPHVSRLYSACVGCHVASLVAIVALVAATIRYYPKIPEYNICNDSVAWSSLMASLTSLKATADFEILASVSNLNHFDILLDRGSKGSFSHNGVPVGTFDIPPVRAAAVSVTDVLVVAHLTPEKWEALSLTAEYYRGVLVLDVDVTAKIRIPALWNFATTRTLRNIEVHVNELADRRLCACEDWDSARNHTAAASALLLGEIDEQAADGSGTANTADSATPPLEPLPFQTVE